MARVSRGTNTVPHPRKVPRLDGPLTADALEAVFRDCVDFTRREVELAGLGRLSLCYLGGMVRMERVSDYVLRPLAEDRRLRQCRTMGEAMERMEGGALYNLGTARRDTLDQAAAVAVRAVRAFLAEHSGPVETVTFVCFSQPVKDAFDRALGE